MSILYDQIMWEDTQISSIRARSLGIYLGCRDTCVYRWNSDIYPLMHMNYLYCIQYEQFIALDLILTIQLSWDLIHLFSNCIQNPFSFKDGTLIQLPIIRYWIKWLVASRKSVSLVGLSRIPNSFCSNHLYHINIYNTMPMQHPPVICNC